MGKLSLTTQILISIALGILLGLIAGPSVGVFSDLTKVIVQCIKVAAIPLLAFNILLAIVSSDVKLSSGLKMVFIAMLNASMALAIGLTITHFMRPGDHLAAVMQESLKADLKNSNIPIQKIDFVKTIIGYFPQSIVQPFDDNAVIPIVLMMIVLGLAIRANRKSFPDYTSSIERGLKYSLGISEWVLFYITKFVPLAVLFAVAKSVGEYGFKPFHALGLFLIATTLGFLLQMFGTYTVWIKFISGMSLKRFWKQAKSPMIYSVGTNSSLATLPLTLKALDNLGVSQKASTLGACVGTNLNNDGIILYEVMAVLFVAHTHGITMTLQDQIFTALTCMIAAMGVAGIPEAGIISLSLVLATTGLPVETLPLLLTVDWFLARARSVVNVASDMVVSIGIDRLEGKHFH